MFDLPISVQAVAIFAIAFAAAVAMKAIILYVGEYLADRQRTAESRGEDGRMTEVEAVVDSRSWMRWDPGDFTDMGGAMFNHEIASKQPIESWDVSGASLTAAELAKREKAKAIASERELMARIVALEKHVDA